MSYNPAPDRLPDYGTDRPMGFDRLDRQEKVSPGKLHVTQYLVVAVLAVLAAGMWRLQIVGVDSYRQLAEANRVRKIPVPAPRGKIFDRDGRLLVDNYPSVSCFLLREQVKDLEADIPLIARGLNLPADQIQAALRHYAAAPKYQPIPLKEDITPDEQAFLEAHRNELPELETVFENSLYKIRRLRILQSGL